VKNVEILRKVPPVNSEVAGRLEKYWKPWCLLM